MFDYNEWRREWRKKNPDKVKAQKERMLEKDPQRFSRYDRKSYLLHRMKRIAKARRWNIENKEVVAAREAARRAAKNRATPAWADKEAIEATYVLAARLTQERGIEHQVDHVIPLVSKIVCGLHVPANLQVITALENQSKNNKRWPDMPVHEV